MRWGTALHDRFMLPHFVWSDFMDVLGDLTAPATASIRVGSRPNSRFAFRSWQVSTAASASSCATRWSPGTSWARRAPAGTVRSWISRLSGCRCASGLNPGRHVITCNGRALPMTPTGVSMEAVAGVRYKAWKLPSDFIHHPVHAPLTFDIVDRWNKRSLGGCVYHVAHPGGRNYDTFPVNSYEAQARRKARFEDHGHTPGRDPPPGTTGEFPLTLDLRTRPGP